MQKIDTIISTLENYKKLSAQDAGLTQQIIDWIKHHGEFAFFKENLDGHVTASIFILNQNKTKVLLMFHKKYQEWTHFGWHCDGEIDTKNVAIREFHEESGIIREPEIIGDIFSIQIWDVDERTSSSGMFQPAHHHYDILYLGSIPEDTPFARQEDEVDDIRWFDIVGIEKYISEDRMLQMFRRIADTHLSEK